MLLLETVLLLETCAIIRENTVFPNTVFPISFATTVDTGMHHLTLSLRALSQCSFFFLFLFDFLMAIWNDFVCTMRLDEEELYDCDQLQTKKRSLILFILFLVFLILFLCWWHVSFAQVNSILRHVAGKLNYDNEQLETLYTKTAWALEAKYKKSAYAVFKQIVTWVLAHGQKSPLSHFWLLAKSWSYCLWSPQKGCWGVTLSFFKFIANFCFVLTGKAEVWK